MKALKAHEAKTQVSGRLAEIAAKGGVGVICRHGTPVADLVPHRRTVSMAADPKWGAILLHYELTEGVSAADWLSAL